MNEFEEELKRMAESCKYSMSDVYGELAKKIKPVRLIEEILAENEKLEVKVFKCPSCNGVVDIVDNYCKHCGQKFEEWI